MKDSKRFVEAQPGTVVGPMESSPGNPMRWQYAIKLKGGSWAPVFGKTMLEAKTKTDEYLKDLKERGRI